MANKLIKMWVPVEFKKNLMLKQARIKSDLGIKVPLNKIAYALSRQPLVQDTAGIDLRRMRWGKIKK